MLLLPSQRCLKFENLNLDLLDFLESGDLAVIDLVAHARYPGAQEHHAAYELNPEKHRSVKVPVVLKPWHREGQGSVAEDDSKNGVDGGATHLPSWQLLERTTALGDDERDVIELGAGGELLDLFHNRSD